MNPKVQCTSTLPAASSYKLIDGLIVIINAIRALREDIAGPAERLVQLETPDKHRLGNPLLTYNLRALTDQLNKHSPDNNVAKDVHNVRFHTLSSSYFT